ncbi:MAG: hypothetical protein GXY03_06345 [Solirubrobacterales bacterium]|nr:hypothetical protein [Solirubrobacterales bacterium]
MKRGVGRRFAVGTAVLLAAGALAACGDDGDGGGGADAAAGTPEAEARAAFDRMRDALAAEDGAAACGELSEEANRQFAGLSTEDPPTCADGFETYLTAGDLTEDTDPTVVAIDVRGNRATVHAELDSSPGPQTARLVQEDGTWKVASWLTD